MSSKINLSPPPSIIDSGLSFAWLRWFEQIFDRLGSGPLKVNGYSRTNLPPAKDWGNTSVTGEEYSSIIFVHDAATTGATLAYSDGVNWLNVQTGAAV